MASTPREPTLSDALAIFFRHWKLVAIILAIALLTVPLFSKLKRPSFESRAELPIKFGNQAIQHNPTGTDAARSNYMAQWELAVKSEIEILRNEYLAAKVVDELGTDFDKLPEGPPPEGLWDRLQAGVFSLINGAFGLFFDLLRALHIVEDLPPREDAIGRILSGLQVNNVQDTSVLEVKFRTRNPSVARPVLDRLIQLYLTHHMNVHRTPGVLEFFDGQLTEQTGFLARAEDAYEAFRQRHGIASVADQINILLNTTNTLWMKQKNLELELIGYRSKFAEATPVIQSVRQQIQETQTNYEKAAAELEKLNSVVVKDRRMERNVDVAEEAFLLYNRKRQESEILDAMDISKILNVSIIQPASVPLQAMRILPFVPDRGLFFLLATFMGLVTGLSLAVLLDYLDPTFREPGELEAWLERPVWGVIPEERRYRRPVSS